MTLIKSLLTLTVGITLLASPYGHAEDYGRAIEPDSTVVTEHKTTINGDRGNYTATTGTQPVWNDEGEAVAALHYTYYKRSDIKDDSTRPLVISFNGGPGSASVWMHIAYTGPVILNIDDEVFCAYTGVSLNDLSGSVDEAATVRLRAVIEVFERVEPWFDSSTEAWSWFTSKPLVGFGSKVPADVIREYGAQGVESLMQFVKSKDLGGFE